MEVRLRVCTLTQIQAYKNTHTRAHTLGDPHTNTCFFVYGQNFSVGIFLDTTLLKYIFIYIWHCYLPLCNTQDLKKKMFLHIHLFDRHILVSIVALIFAIMHFI